MNYGFVYCLRNEAMPGIYKIGMTERAPMQRCIELSSSTSIPFEFEILFYAEVEDPRGIEREMHEGFAEFRVSENREFFSADPRHVLSYMETVSDFVMVSNYGKEELSILDFQEKKAAAIRDAASAAWDMEFEV